MYKIIMFICMFLSLNKVYANGTDSIYLRDLVKKAANLDLDAESMLFDLAEDKTKISTIFKYFVLVATKHKKPEDQNIVGYMYLLGIGIKQDYEEALKWFNLASNDSSAASYHIALIYFQGLGVNRNYNKAWEWLNKSIEKSNPMAQFYAGYIYYHGKYGTKRDYKKALALFKLAAEQNSKFAQIMLGEMYYEGNGVEQDYEEALKWFKLSLTKDPNANMDNIFSNERIQNIYNILKKRDTAPSEN